MKLSESLFSAMGCEVAHMCALSMWPEDNSLESVLFCHVDSGDQPPVTRVGSKCLYSLRIPLALCLF